MNNGLGLLSSETATTIPIKADPRLKLLFELEPRYIVFLDNLADLLSPPKLPPLTPTSPPGEFWPDVFIATPKPWRSFQEAVIWHLVAIVAIWSLSGKGWMLHREPQTKNPLREAQHITYYPPSRTYSARASSHPNARTPKPRPVAAHQRPLEVAREARRPGALVVPPDLKTAMARPNIGSSAPVPPSVPLAATQRTSGVPAGMTSVVAPPPDVKGSGRTGAALPTSAIAPPPDVGGVSAGHAAASSNAAVIAPPPTLQTWVRKLENLFGDSSSAKGSGVVPPPPSVSGTGAGHVGELGGGSPSVVPPPPSTDGGGAGGGRSLSSVAASVVPPPPSMSGIGGGRGTALSGGGGSKIIPPPPSVQGSGGVAGRLGSLSGGNGNIVPPPPALQGVGNGRSGSLGAGGSNVVPPPPSVGAGGGGRGRLSLSDSAGQVVPPPPALLGLGGSGGGALSASAGTPGVIPPPPSISGSGSGGGRGRRGSLSGPGAEIVPPPPVLSAGSAGAGAGNGRIGGFGGSGSSVVPPPPSVPGVGSGGSGGRLKSLAGGGAGVIPPPPSVQGAGGGAGGHTAASLGSGTSVVPPPPSVSGEGAGGSGSGRLAGLSGPGSNAAVPPPPSVSGAGGGGTGRGPVGSLGGPDAAVGPPSGGAAAGGGAGSTGPLQQMDDDIPSAADVPATNEAPPGPAEEFPLRLVSLALPTQGSSFFSNYEVYIAERRLPRGQSQLIKLVYTFLPYQKRLSEYIQSNARVYTLRVTRDPSCDESLMQLTWSDTGTDGADSMFPGNDRNSKLPCYRLTADDYQRALVRSK